MTDVETCDKVGCSNTFDIDLDEGIMTTEWKELGIVTTKYYCCVLHRDESE